MGDDVGVRSEVGRLRAVLVHRPGLELRRLTPSNKEELLFDELIWVDRAQVEHDAFAATMETAGAEVLHLADLLEELLADDEVAREVVRTQVTETTCGAELAVRVRAFLLDQPRDQLTAHLIGGLSIAEVGGGDGLVARVNRPYELLLTALPNAVFMRDSSAWIGEGVLVAPMNRMVRRRESDLLRLVYTLHPRFGQPTIYLGAEPTEPSPGTIEGGDILVVGDRGVAIGISERTTTPAIEALASRLFAADVIDRIIAVDLPKSRSTMHLDTVVTMVDRDAFLLYPQIRPEVRCFRITPRAGGRLLVEDEESLVAGLAWAAGLDAVRTIEPAFDNVMAEREQWNDANNVLAVAPGEVVAYERNEDTNRILEDAGITVRLIPSYELPRGRGGPRCMTCPVLRDPL